MSPFLPEIRGREAMPAWAVTACLVLCITQALFFPLAYGHLWIVDEAGRGIPTDFVNVWSAGRLVLEGHPAWAYDWDIQKTVQLAILGQGYDGNFAWHYPPPFLFVAAALASFPYVGAFMAWPLLTFIPYAAVMRALVGRPFGWLLAGAFPALLVNAAIGQNGFLTAALIGGTLYFLPSRPVLAGVLLGLLSYKPQYGFLFPLVLLATLQWRAFFSAAAVTLALALASLLAFGLETWQAFFHWLPMFSQAFLSEGRAYWGKMQSLFATIRLCHGSEPLAWAAQWTLDAVVAIGLVRIWRSATPYWIKAAALATATLLVTPYLFLYDVMVLAIPVALLVRAGLSEGFRPHEPAALGLAFLLLASYLALGLPTGFAATLIVAALLVRRYRATMPARLAPLPPAGLSQLPT
ncbi:MAG: glycosyltransferase family 87 protein [Xanthobacteraceae bacterium]|nr:glycosyltransferase family 87 protein [Xanthobacteraceae bacterium]